VLKAENQKKLKVLEKNSIFQGPGKSLKMDLVLESFGI